MTETGEGGTFYTDWNETADSFDQMNLHENLLRGIYAVSGENGERERKAAEPPASQMRDETRERAPLLHSRRMGAGALAFEAEIGRAHV